MRAVLADIDGPVVLGAQVQAQGFYARLGFAVDGPGYDEDGIPHVPMRRP
jgi:ElaA protein